MINRRLAPGSLRFGIARRFRPPAKEPVKAYVKRVGDVAETVEWKMNCGDVKIAASICGKTRSFRDFFRGHSLGSARRVESGRKQRQVRH